MIGLLVPAAAGLAALAGLPLLIHWLSRHKALPRPFPAASLLARAHGGVAQRRRIRDLVVLALRALALACVGLTAAGPVTSGLTGTASRPAAIVLDASCSMRQVNGGATAFASARAAAARLADALGERPLIGIVSGSEPARSGPAPRPGSGAVKALLADAQPGWGDGGLAQAVALAVSALGGPGDVIVVSDGARSALAGIDSGALPSGVTLQIVDVLSGADGANRGIVALAADPGSAIAGRPLTVTARVANFAASDATVPLRLTAGTASRSAELRIPAGGSASLALTLTPENAGFLALSAEIPGGDALAEDDHRDGAVEVLPDLIAVVAGDGSRNDPAGALRPLAVGLGAAGFAVRFADGAALPSGSAVLGGGAALIATAGLASQAAAPALAAHLAAGGTWLQLWCSDADCALRPGGMAPPAAPGARADLASEARAPLALARARLDHPLFEPFAGREPLLALVTALRYRQTPGGIGAEAEALASWADGSVAVAERRVGRGRWIVLNASTAGVDTSLARSEAWPLLCSRLAALCSAPAREDAARAAGTTVEAAWLEGPAGGRREARAGSVLLDRAGLWRGDGGRLIAAAIPAGESDLRRIGGAAAATHTTEAAVAATERRPAWPWLLALAALALATELVISGAVRRKTAI